jgi:hypothetical protein
MPYNSTIRIKEKICVSCGKPCVWFSKKRCQQCAKVESFHAKEEELQKEEDGLPELIDRLDGLVSKYVRMSAADMDRNCECYTCGDKRMWMLMDAGHYITRSCMYLRFDTSRNIRPQCPICNRAKYGMAAAFGKHLEIEMPNVTEILLEESRIVYKYTREELRNLITDYTQRIKLLTHGK